MSTPIIKGVAEIVINVRDLSVMQTFYENVLGFRFHSQYPDNEPTIVFLTISDLNSPLGHGGHPQLFALVDAERHSYTKDHDQGSGNQRSSLNHLAFEIDEAALVPEKKRLEDYGLSVEIHEFPHMQAKGLFFHDPEDNMIELICHSPF